MLKLQRNIENSYFSTAARHALWFADCDRGQADFTCRSPQCAGIVMQFKASKSTACCERTNKHSIFDQNYFWAFRFARLSVLLHHCISSSRSFKIPFFLTCNSNSSIATKQAATPSPATNSYACHSKAQDALRHHLDQHRHLVYPHHWCRNWRSLPKPVSAKARNSLCALRAQGG